MADASRPIQRTYLVLVLLTTLATSFIWGINTLFLLDAGLDNTQAFTVNAFYTVGQVLFEVPTGIVADARGRRFSVLCGTATLFIATLLYVALWQLQAGLLAWAIVSAMLGLGFTFFSGAMTAWLVDALQATGYRGALESVLARGQVVAGAAMLLGSILGGVVAQATTLGVPYLIRAVLLGLTLVFAFVAMRELGFSPVRRGGVGTEVRLIVDGSVEHGLRNPPVRWLMLAAPFTSGVGIYAFYAFQPYLLELYGDPTAYSVAGLAAAAIAGAQILAGVLVPRVRRLFALRTHVLIAAASVSVITLALVGLVNSFVVAFALIVVWGTVSAIEGPLRQAFLNGIIPSAQRATVLSFDNLMGSAGGVVTQPVLGRVADIGGYGASYLVAAGIQVLAIPFLVLARRERASSDPIEGNVAVAGP